MPLKVPLNQIVVKYTSGNEYMFLNNYREYKGYYYEFNNDVFAGEKFNENALKLIKINSDKVNSLVTNPSTFTYGKISGIKLNNSKPKSYLYQNNDEDLQKGTVIRYFLKQLNNSLILEVNKDTFYQFISNSLYQSIQINFIFSPGYPNGIPQNIDQAEQKMSGIKKFLLG